MRVHTHTKIYFDGLRTLESDIIVLILLLYHIDIYIYIYTHSIYTYIYMDGWDLYSKHVSSMLKKWLSSSFETATPMMSYVTYSNIKCVTFENAVSQ